MEHVAAQQVEGKAILLQLETGAYFALDPVGSSIWALCDGSRTIAAIAEAICGEYAVDREVAERDVEALFDELERERLVRFD